MTTIPNLSADPCSDSIIPARFTAKPASEGASLKRRDAITLGAAGVAVALTSAATAQAQEPAAGADLEEIRALLKAHDDATTNHDLKGVTACLAEKAAIMGTGPGEIYVGPEEIKVAYEHFFEGYDKGAQDFEYHFKIGGLSAEMGWLMASGNVKGKKAGKDFVYPLNVSLTVAKSGGKWLIAAMHFSTLTGDGKAEASSAK